MAKFRQFAVDLATSHNITPEELLAGFIAALKRGDLSDMLLQQDISSETRADTCSTQNVALSNDSSVNTAEVCVDSHVATAAPGPGPTRQRNPIYKKESLINDQDTPLPQSNNTTYRAQMPSSPSSKTSDAKAASHKLTLPANMHDPKTSDEDGALSVSVEACSVGSYTHYFELSKPRAREKRDGEQLCNNCAPGVRVEECSVDSYTHYLELTRPRANEERDVGQFCNHCAIL